MSLRITLLLQRIRPPKGWVLPLIGAVSLLLPVQVRSQTASGDTSTLISIPVGAALLPVEPVTGTESEAGSATPLNTDAPNGVQENTRMIDSVSLTEYGAITNKPANLSTGNPIDSSNATPGDDDSETPKWVIKPGLVTKAYYDNNVFLQHENQRSSGVLDVGAGLAYALGDYKNQQNSYLDLSYEAVGILYSSITGSDYLTQAANLRLQYAWDKFRILWTSSYGMLGGPNRDIGNFATQTILYNALAFQYLMTEKTRLIVGLEQNSSIYAGSNNSSYEQLVKLRADHQMTEKTILGLVGAVGSNPTEGSPTRYFEEVGTRFKYQLAHKVAFRINVSALANQWPTSGQSNVTPVGDLQFDFNPFARPGDHSRAQIEADQSLMNLPRALPGFGGSDFTLAFYRHYQNSAAQVQANSYFMATGVLISANKTIGRFFTSWIVGYENDQFYSDSSSNSKGSYQNYAFVKPAAGYNFLKYYKVQTFFTYRFENSNQQEYNFNGYQIGAEVSASF